MKSFFVLGLVAASPDTFILNAFPIQLHLNGSNEVSSPFEVKFLGGLQLNSTVHEFSSIIHTGVGSTILGVTDEGDAVEFDLIYSRDSLIGVSNYGKRIVLADSSGTLLNDSKSELGDAEGIARVPFSLSGIESTVVLLESAKGGRVLHFDVSPGNFFSENLSPSEKAWSSGISFCPNSLRKSNGFESIAWANGGLVVVCEEGTTKGNLTVNEGRWMNTSSSESFSLVSKFGLHPVEIRSEGGLVWVLWRRFNRDTRLLEISLEIFPESDLVSNAVINGTLVLYLTNKNSNLDNFEAMTVQRLSRDCLKSNRSIRGLQTDSFLVTMLSDDNDNKKQRTLLYSFGVFPGFSSDLKQSEFCPFSELGSLPSWTVLTWTVATWISAAILLMVILSLGFWMYLCRKKGKPENNNRDRPPTLISF